MECAFAVVGHLQRQGMPDRKAAVLQLGDVAAEERVELAFAEQRLAVVLLKVRFVIERIDMADTTEGEDVDDTLGPGGEMRPRGRGFRFGAVTVLVEKPGERDSA